MRQDFASFDAAKRMLSVIHTRCSEIVFDPDASEERKVEALAFRRSLNEWFSASDGGHCKRIREEARARAREFFGEPDFNVF